MSETGKITEEELRLASLKLMVEHTVSEIGCFEDGKNSIENFANSLFEDNQKMREYIQEMELVMEIVMKKYRTHTKLLVEESRINFLEALKLNMSSTCECWRTIDRQREQIDSLSEITTERNCEIKKLQSKVNQLETENATLREFLRVAKQYNLIG